MKQYTPRNMLTYGALGAFIFLGIMVLSMVLLEQLTTHQHGYDVWVKGQAVTAEKIRKVGDAIAKYELAKGERPMALRELVGEGLLTHADMCDPDMADLSESVPDVLYFPALVKDDPGDLVLLCTLLLREKEDKFQVIRNDGSYDALDANALTIALNRTYTYIGRQIAKQPSAEDSNVE